VNWFDLVAIWSLQVHGDYAQDIGTKVDRPAEETVAEEPTEIVGA
jgi:small subunit ribosomal protein S3Ae